MKEEEIRPKALFEHYLKLAEEDVKAYFSDCEYHERKCPACGSLGDYKFNKKGFDYYQCKKCRTLYVNPVPDDGAFREYYKSAPSTKFWAAKFYRLTEEARREKLFKPKAKKIDSFIKKFGDKLEIIVEIGAGYGTFSEELISLGYNVIAVEPNAELQKVLKSKNINLIPKFIEEVEKKEIPDTLKMFISFELVEHLHNPKHFFKKIHGLMNIGDLFLFTTLNNLGFDIKLLGKDSKSVHPPHHINLLNPKSSRILLENLGFEIIQITTPGELDVDILANNLDKIKDKSWREKLEKMDENDREELQQYLKDNNLSSHMWVLCRKI